MTTVTLKSGVTYDDTAIGALLDRLPQGSTIPGYAFHFEGHGDYTPDGKIDNPPLTNDELSAIELWGFCNQPPERLFAYIRKSTAANVPYRRMPSGYGASFDHLVTTWIGDSLGEARLGNAYHCPAFWRQSTRRSVTLHAVNGYWYYGTYFESSGDYCRLRRGKQWK